MRTREEVRAALDGNFKELMDCLGQLTEDELTSTAVTGEWTVKDVIAHVWAWSDEALQTAKAWNKPRPWQEGISYDDAWNEAQVSAKRVLPLITVVDGITGTHRRLVHLLDMADEAMLDQVALALRGEMQTFLDFIDSIGGHYVEHAQDLLAYQLRCLDADSETDQIWG